MPGLVSNGIWSCFFLNIKKNTMVTSQSIGHNCPLLTYLAIPCTQCTARHTCTAFRSTQCRTPYRIFCKVSCPITITTGFVLKGNNKIQMGQWEEWIFWWIIGGCKILFLPMYTAICNKNNILWLCSFSRYLL